MKMIASTKLAKAQRAMQSGKEYGLANSGASRKQHIRFCILKTT
jgi:F0F1-type ATP synthase gamma subunit